MKAEKSVRFVGLDVHRETIAICVLDATGKIIHRETIKSRRPALLTWLDCLRAAGGTKARFALEALGASRWVYLELVKEGFEANLVHPHGVQLIVKSKKKSDRVDAYQLADLLRLGRLPLAHVPSASIRELRQLVRHRACLRQTATRTKNRVHAILHERDLHFDGTDVFGCRGRKWLAGIRFEGATKLHVKQLLEQLDMSERQIAEVDGAIEAQIEGEVFYTLLETIPGVGPTLGSIIVAEAGDIRRFDTPDQFAAYAGLVPATWESAGSRTTGKITRQGNHLLRYALVQAALQVCRWSKEVKERYTKLRRRIKKHKARVAMARRLAVTIWYMARNGEAFRYTERPPKDRSKKAA